MESDEVYVLVDGHYERGWTRLGFAKHTGEPFWWADGSFKPYFYIPADDFHAVERTDLFTGQRIKLGKVIGEEPSTYEVRWEDDVDPVLSYVYDHNLNFGLPYKFNGDEFIPVLQEPTALKTQLDGRFAPLRQTDPQKSSLLDEFFQRTHQPIPNIDLHGFNLSRRKVSREEYCRAVLLSRIANIPIADSLRGFSASLCLRSLLHGVLRRKGILIPSDEELRKGETKRAVQGALTLAPVSGTYFNMVVADFQSLYASCIDTFNLSYETIDCGHRECESNVIPDGLGYVCRKRRGVYSALVGALKDLRIHWCRPLSQDPRIGENERLTAQVASDLLKLILVSSYGVTVRIRGLASPKLGESITAYGRHVLQTTWDLASENGLKPRYGDTDSVFLDNPSDDNVLWLIRQVKERWNLDLAVEKRYSLCVLSSAKKAYFGILPEGIPDLKGLTLVKSNSPKLFQKVFSLCVKELRHVRCDSEFEAAKVRVKGVVREQVRIIRQGEVTMEDLSYRVKLHVEPSAKSRAKVLPQPYQAATQLLEHGGDLGRYAAVDFVKVKPFKHGNRTFTVKPTTQASISEIDIDDYVRTLKLALAQVFEPMQIDFEEEGRESVLTQYMGKQ